MKKHIFSKKVVMGFILLLLIIVISLYVWKEERRPAVLEMYVFNLKTGNAAFIRTPDDQRILINGGSNSEVIRHISKILPFYSRRIDMVMATDTEKKNGAGLVGVLERYSVEQLIVPAVTLKSFDLASSTDASYLELLKVARKKKVSIREVVEGEKLILREDNSTDQITLDILFPAKAEGFTYSKASSPEIVMIISYGSNTILLMGNSSKKIQKYVANDLGTSKYDVKVNVLVVSHGATESNLDKNIIENLKPEYLIYSQSTGRSVATVGFPYEKRFNVKEKGVKIVSDGDKATIKNY